MNLTDDQIRSLRADCEAAVIPYASRAQREAAMVRLPTTTVLSLVEEVEAARARVNELLACLRACETDRDMARIKADALAAKAEAGKGLYEWLTLAGLHLASCPGRHLCTCGLGPALARWEAVENG